MQPSHHHVAHPIHRALNAADGSHVVRAFCFALDALDATPQEWIPYLPAPINGRLIGEDGRSWIAGDLRATAAQVKRRLPVDINHSTDLVGKAGGDAPAVGWITEFQVRDDGSTWARVSWNERGLNAVAKRDYGFISPFFDHDKSGRITAFAGASLVNEPNFTQLALNSRQHSETHDMTLEQLLALLGLPAAGTLDDAQRAINALRSERDRALNAAQTPDLQRFVPRTDYAAMEQRALNAEQAVATTAKAQLDKDVDAALDAATQAGKIAPASREFYRANCLREGGLEQFRAFVTTQPVIVPAEERAQAQRQAQTQAGQLTDNQRAICRNLGVAEADYLKHLQSVQTAH